MIARYQKLLRSGKPRRDIGVLRLDYNFYNTLFRVNDEEHFYGHELMRANEGIYWKDTSMQNMGYSYDYFSPQLLDDPDIIFGDGVLQPEGPAYQAILIYQEYMPVDSARILLKYAQGDVYKRQVYYTSKTGDCCRSSGDRIHGIPIYAIW